MKAFSFLLLFLFLASCWKPEVALQKYYTTRTAELSSIDVTQSYIGYIESDIVTTLSSEIPGKILDMYVDEGAYLTAWSPIVSINVDTNIVGYQGSANIIWSLSVMQESIAESFDTQVGMLESQLRQAQIELSSNSTSLSDTLSIQEKESLANESSILVAQENLLLAETEKIEAEKMFATKKSQLSSNAKNALTGLMIIDTNAASYLDELFSLTVENKYKNDTYEAFLGVKDSTQKEQTLRSAQEWYTSFLEVQALYESRIQAIASPLQSDVDIVLEKSLVLNNNLKTLLSEVYKVYENTLESVPYMSTDIIEQGKTRVSTFGSQIEQALLSASGNMLVWAQAIDQNLTTLEDERQKTLALLENKISLLQAQLENVRKNTEITPSLHSSQINQNTTQKALLQEKITQTQESLKNLAAAKKARLAEIDSQMTQASVEGSLQQLQAGKWEITSPISGIITKKYVETWSVVNPWQPLLEISDTSSKKITLDISPEVLERLKIGDEAYLLFEGKDDFISAKVSFIYPFQEELSRKTQVELRSEGFDDIPLGSRASIYLSTEEKQGVTIPKKTIIELYGVPGVYIVFHNTAEFRHIEIIEQNDDIAVVSGIQAGDELILLGKENIFDGESLEGYMALPE